MRNFCCCLSCAMVVIDTADIAPSEQAQATQHDTLCTRYDRSRPGARSSTTTTHNYVPGRACFEHEEESHFSGQFRVLWRPISERSRRLFLLRGEAPLRCIPRTSVVNPASSAMLRRVDVLMRPTAKLAHVKPMMRSLSSTPLMKPRRTALLMKFAAGTLTAAGAGLYLHERESIHADLSPDKAEDVDALIVGGGIMGTTVAILLKLLQPAWNVRLIEQVSSKQAAALTCSSLLLSPLLSSSLAGSCGCRELQRVAQCRHRTCRIVRGQLHATRPQNGRDRHQQSSRRQPEVRKRPTWHSSHMTCSSRSLAHVKHHRPRVNVQCELS